MLNKVTKILLSTFITCFNNQFNRNIAKKENKPFDLALKSCENDSSGGVPIVIESQEKFQIARGFNDQDFSILAAMKTLT